MLFKTELVGTSPGLEHNVAAELPSVDAERVRVAMLLWNSCAHDSRVIKEAESLVAAGYQVRVFCLSEPGMPDIEQRNGVAYVRFSQQRSFLRALLSPSSQRASTQENRPATRQKLTGYQVWQRFLGILRPWGSAAFKRYREIGSPLGKPRRHARAFATLGLPAVAFRPHVVHAHDLITLTAAATVARETGARLVYDSHEYALNVSNPPRGIARLQDWLHERQGIRQADAVITVSPSIAGRLKRDYRIRRPSVIYNAPSVARTSWSRDVRNDLGMADGIKLAVQVGGLARNRGIEEVVSALRFMEDFHLVFVGPTNQEYEARLYAQARQDGTDTRLHFLKPVPSDTLIPYLRTADVGVIAYQNVCLNHEYCMPNKLFECALAGVPLAVSNLKDLRGFVTRHRIGLVMDETDPISIGRTIQKVYDQRAVLRPGADRLSDLRDRCAWETQARKLTRLYEVTLARDSLNPALTSTEVPVATPRH